jgi:nucleotide-binding universal stress UspA family protein
VAANASKAGPRNSRLGNFEKHPEQGARLESEFVKYWNSNGADMIVSGSTTEGSKSLGLVAIVVSLLLLMAIPAMHLVSVW